MKKLKENVHAIQVGCQICEGAHFDKEYPQNEEVKSIEEVKYGEFGRPSPFSNGVKHRIGLPGYNTHIDNRPPFGETKPSLEELMNKHIEESTRRRAKIKEWVKKLLKRGSGLSFLEFLLAKYGETQGNDLIWYKRYVEWCNENSSPNTPTLKFTSIQEDYKPRPKDYPFKDWLLTKVGHTDVSEPIKRALLKTWLIDCFQEELVKDPRSRSFDDYKWMFKLEINQLTVEYVLGIGKKGHMLDDICENYKKVPGDNTYWWFSQQGIRIQGLLGLLSYRFLCRCNHQGYAVTDGITVGNKVAQLTIYKNSILIRNEEQQSRDVIP
ncbi:hypothetical protein Tco_0986461, partial [Tanacetum coccineum]